MFSKTLVYIFLASLLAFSGCGGGSGGSNSADSVCSDVGLTPKVVNGTRCNENDAAIVQIEILRDDNTVASCSGAFISPTHILTAGHCFNSSNAAIESSLITFGNQSIGAVGYSVHPLLFENSNNGVIVYDLAIVEVPEVTSVNPLSIYSSTSLTEGDEFSIFGYGLNGSGQLRGLQGGRMSVSEVNGAIFQAAFNGSGSNACNGDSGGPAVVIKDGLAGIAGLVSTGSSNSNCQSGDISLFSALSDPVNLQFILALVPEVNLL